jgi:hypothetical protein
MSDFLTVQQAARGVEENGLRNRQTRFDPALALAPLTVDACR